MTFSKKVLLFCSLFVLTLVGSPIFAQGFGKDVDAPVRLVNPIGGTEANPTGNVDTRVIFGSAIRVTLGFLGTFTLAVFFYGGYLWLTSAGSSDKVQKGTQTMLYAVIGLFIIFGAYGILNTVISGILGGATAPASSGPTITAGAPVVTPEQEALPCEGQNRDTCTANSSRCTYLVFHFPENQRSVTECIDKGQREGRCLILHSECLEATVRFAPNCDNACRQQILNNPEATRECDTERDLCMRL